MVGLVDAGDERSRFRRSNLEPVIESPDRVSGPVVPAGNADELAASVTVGLGSADVDQDPGRFLAVGSSL